MQNESNGNSPSSNCKMIDAPPHKPQQPEDTSSQLSSEWTEQDEARDRAEYESNFTIPYQWEWPGEAD
jgi:hypothetical protein